MDNDRNIKETSLKHILDSFIGSYAERDGSGGFADWLASRILQEIPDMPEETGKKLAGEIMEAVAAYDRTLAELNAAVSAGQSKEEWFAERLSETYAGMSMDAAGEKLRQIEDAIVISNTQLMQEIDNTQADETNIINADAAPATWNEYSVKEKAYEIGRQAALSGMAVAANVLRDRVQGDETAGISEIVRDTLQDGLKKDPGEVKAAVAGAVRVAAMRGLEGALPEDTPMETVCDMAGVAVESAEALFDVASGESTMTEAMDRIGRAGVAAGCRYAGDVLEGVLAKVPYAGPVLVDLAGGLLDHMTSSKFVNNVYTVVRDAAAAAWKGIKESRTAKVLGRVLSVFT